MVRSYRVRITETAERDLQEIQQWIAESHPTTAVRFLNELYSHTHTLQRFPERCPFIRENKFLRKPYRHLVHKKYRIIFRVEKKTVYIVRVIHGSRRLRKI
jgi:plasmid stabilization system protein ParE